VRLREMLTRVLEAWFARATAAELWLVSCAAGLGEEALFRGLLQRGPTPSRSSCCCDGVERRYFFAPSTMRATRM
jgi:hypothetical protein